MGIEKTDEYPELRSFCYNVNNWKHSLFMVFDISWKLCIFFLRVEVTAPSTGQNETPQHCVTTFGLKLTRGLFYLYKRLVDLLYRTMKNSFYSDRFLIFELW